MQPAGVVLLDDEGVVVARVAGAFGRAPAPASCAAIAHAAVGGQLVWRRRRFRRARRAGRRRARRARAPRRRSDAAARDPRSPPRCAARRRSDGRGRAASTARSWSSAELFWLQSRNTLPARRLLVIVAVTCLGMVFSSCCAIRLASTDAPRELHRLGQRDVQMQALAAAGERIRGQPDVGHQAADLVGHLAQLTERDVLAGVEVEHDARRRTGLRVRRTATAARALPARPAGRSTPALRGCR